MPLEFARQVIVKPLPDGRRALILTDGALTIAAPLTIEVAREVGKQLTAPDIAVAQGLPGSDGPQIH